MNYSVFISVYQEVKCDYSYNMQKFLFHQLVSSKLMSKAQLNTFALRFHLSHRGTTVAQMEVFNNSGVVQFHTVTDPKIFKGRGRKTIYQSRRHLSQIYIKDCMSFTRKKAAF